MEGNRATALKEDRAIAVPEDSIREGDILLLQAGDLVPADLKLLEAHGVEIDGRVSVE